MAPRVCVDASLVICLLLPEEKQSEAAEALWARWQRDGSVLIAPSLLYAEVPSVLRAAVFFQRVSPDEGEDAFDIFCNMGIAVSTKQGLPRLAWELAREHNQPRVYDTMYLATAFAEGCHLWAADRRLVNAVNLPWVRSVEEQPG